MLDGSAAAPTADDSTDAPIEALQGEADEADLVEQHLGVPDEDDENEHRRDPT